MSLRIGFMQGRLSSMVNGKIQAFPVNEWENEFKIANNIGIHLMEWTLDYENLYQNPLMNALGQKKIIDLSKRFKLSIKSLTGDCFMQNPFWKCKDLNEKEKLENDFINILFACKRIGINIVVIPLVDNGSIENKDQKNYLTSFLLSKINLLKDLEIRIAFEADMDPDELLIFIENFPSTNFGINYDVGNSAALGFNPSTEFKLYGDKIINIHIKDRKFASNTVALGEGDANFDLIFKLISQNKYNGDFILQTARDPHEEHDKLILKYKNLINNYIRSYL